MFVDTRTYVDYNGVTRTETFYFNLTETEIMEMEMGTVGGFAEMVKAITAAKDAPAIMKVFKDILFKSYGEKSPDGRRLIKSEELSTAYSQTEAYNQLFMELITDDNAASKFINSIIPTVKSAGAISAVNSAG